MLGAVGVGGLLGASLHAALTSPGAPTPGTHHAARRPASYAAGQGTGRRWQAVGASTVTFPFVAPHGLRPPRPSEAIPSLYADGLTCSLGCPAPGALAGWPLRPFHRQHPLRAGLNELRPGSLHVGVDIQARDGAGVYAVQPGTAHVLSPTGPNARVQVGNFIYWHVRVQVHSGSLVRPFATKLGAVMSGYGHIALSEVNASGQYVNPLRPGGRTLSPWMDRAPPVIAHASVARDGTAIVAAYDPQSFVQRTTYLTPVLAPAAIAYRLYDSAGLPVTPLRSAFAGTHLLAWAEHSDIYAPGAHAPGYACFATRPVCRPHWVYWLAGGLAPRLPIALPVGRYRLTVYAWDWADNQSALDTTLWMTAAGWRPRGAVPATSPTLPGNLEYLRTDYGRAPAVIPAGAPEHPPVLRSPAPAPHPSPGRAPARDTPGAALTPDQGPAPGTGATGGIVAPSSTSSSPSGR